MGKRKRSGGASTDGAPPAKKQETSTRESPSAAKRRQLRSERKSKKAQHAKQNAAKKHAAVVDEPEFVQAETVAGDDTLAGGDDFVPLADAPPTAPLPKQTASQKSNKRLKKEAKKESKRKQAQAGAREADGTIEKKGDDGDDEDDDEDDANDADKSRLETNTTAKKSKDTVRFICFVGNLPYSCTTEQIQHHFRKLDPVSIRHSTDKNTGKSKGFAFLEFDDFSKMKTCLKVYHHSIFDPERTSELPDSAFDENGLAKEDSEQKRPTGRKINVELTAGGGGKGAERKQKIHQKNTKLWEERERRKHAEMKQQKSKEKNKKDEKSEANSTDIGADAVHPSRLRHVQQ